MRRTLSPKSTRIGRDSTSHRPEILSWPVSVCIPQKLGQNLVLAGLVLYETEHINAQFQHISESHMAQMVLHYMYPMAREIICVV